MGRSASAGRSCESWRASAPRPCLLQFRRRSTHSCTSLCPPPASWPARCPPWPQCRRPTCPPLGRMEPGNTSVRVNAAGKISSGIGMKQNGVRPAIISSIGMPMVPRIDDDVVDEANGKQQSHRYKEQAPPSIGATGPHHHEEQRNHEDRGDCGGDPRIASPRSRPG